MRRGCTLIMCSKAGLVQYEVDVLPPDHLKRDHLDEVVDVGLERIFDVVFRELPCGRVGALPWLMHQRHRGAFVHHGDPVRMLSVVFRIWNQTVRKRIALRCGHLPTRNTSFLMSLPHPHRHPKSGATPRP